ncbi:MAG: ATP-dependent RecD-like DNA helicase [Clostridia bacterium]|nr:ATP-dependent RecD-like DNA helicase [Clostridia bacterium]
MMERIMKYNDYNSVSVTGTVTDIIYFNEENGYTICDIDSRENGGFTAVGYMPYISTGENIEMEGSWVMHPEYGEQFSVKQYKTVLPTEKNAILQYLSSGIVKGIREATAKKIVEKFGEDSLNILLNYPEKLSEIKGITKARAAKIGEEYQKLQSMSGIVMFLQQFNISTKAATNVHRILGANAVEKIKENPYILSNEIDGITFKTADNIASVLGIPKNSPERIRAYVRYTLITAAYGSGHTYLPKKMLIEFITRNLGVNDDEAESAISSLSSGKDLFLDTIDGIEVCYLMSLLTAELYVARRICSLYAADQKYTMTREDAERAVNEVAASEGIILAAEQKDAVLTSVSEGCVIITGGPGTGKTTTINTIIKLMQSMKLKIALAAPTGRAAKRMSEVTGIEAKTIHRLLGVVKNDSELSVTFSKNEENPLSADVIIVDEMSMLDINLMNSLLRAIKPGAKLIMVGDCDQLPSVGPGNVLRDLIDSETVPVIRLEHIFRQAQESLIVVNAHRINKGELPVFKSENPNFFFMRRQDANVAAYTIAELYKDRLPAKYGIDPINSIQILSPSRKNILGVASLNNIIQAEINPPDYMKNEYAHGKTIFRVGDKVMQNKNNYDAEWIRGNGEEGMGIFNGDIGIIKKISNIDKEMEIVFDEDKTVIYSFSNLDELELAYAITVHKSQGNEFPYVIIPIHTFPNLLMFRNLLYTAVTRAREMVILVGTEQSIVKMVNNNEISKRYSGLVQKLKTVKKLLDDAN